MVILNLGCGTKTSADVVNIDWSVYLRIKQSPLLTFLAAPFLRSGRREQFDALPENIRVHNLADGIPYPDSSVDAVYHSHFLEHLDYPAVAETFLHEVKRVLKPGGVHRVVVPDMETLCRHYLEHLEKCADNSHEQARHEPFIAEIIEQMVRREAFGSSRQSPLRRWVENSLRGDARQRGETHQWMYDRFTLAALLQRCGFREIGQKTFDSSAIPEWHRLGLDRNAGGGAYKPGSLYMEGVN